MKKTLLASAIAVTALVSINAQADIVITNMSFGGDFASEGTLTDAGDGTMNSIDPFNYHAWTAVQDTGFMDSTAIYNGTSGQGAFDFNALLDRDPITGAEIPGTETDYIGNMTADQRAVGIFFDWNGSNGIALLEIFNCADGICTGNGVPMANGPFAGAIAVFSGTGDMTPHGPNVPVPAAVWLMGSGLLGLVGVARRRKVA